MDKKSYVVPGEAPESDSEEEINYPIKRTVSKNQPNSPSLSQGISILGEAPESDEEETNSDSVSSVTSTSDDHRTTNLPKKIHQEGLQYKTLLHRKLRERNVYLHKDVTDFVWQTVSTAGRDLNASNQQLVRSQVQLQEAITALHLLHNNTLQLDTKLAAIMSSSFLPQINTAEF